jgi:hypothetical protein
LTRDGSPDLLAEGQTLSSGDRVNWVLGNLASRTGTPGTYTLLLSATAGVTDLAGNPLVVDAATSWVETAVPHLISLEAESRTNAAGVIMARAHASQQQTVWLHAWELINVPFTVDATATYAVSLRYSNDNNGPLESSLVWLDDTLVGSAMLQDTGDFGQGWDVFQNTGTIGTQALTGGRHVLTFLVYGGDGFGAEAVVFYLTPASGPFVRSRSVSAPSSWWVLLGQEDSENNTGPTITPPTVWETARGSGADLLRQDRPTAASTRRAVSAVLHRHTSPHAEERFFGWEGAETF